MATIWNNHHFSNASSCRKLFVFRRKCHWNDMASQGHNEIYNTEGRCPQIDINQISIWHVKLMSNWCWFEGPHWYPIDVDLRVFLLGKASLQPMFIKIAKTLLHHFGKQAHRLSPSLYIYIYFLFSSCHPLLLKVFQFLLTSPVCQQHRVLCPLCWTWHIPLSNSSHANKSIVVTPITPQLSNRQINRSGVSRGKLLTPNI